MNAPAAAAPLLSVKQVADRLSISYGEVLKLIHTKKLGIVDIPGRRSYRIDERDLEAFIDSARTEKVDHKVDHFNYQKPVKAQQNQVVKKHGQVREFIVNRNWYK